MLTQDIFGCCPDEFWQVQLHEKKLLQKKSLPAQALWLLLLRWFERKASFPNSVDDIPEDIFETNSNLGQSITLDYLANCFNDNNRLFKRYRQEILALCEFKPFDAEDPNLKQFLIDRVFSIDNKTTLIFEINHYLKQRKIEIPNDAVLRRALKAASKIKEAEVFASINDQLSPDNKQYIDDYILLSDDFDGVCQFLRCDSPASSRQGVAEEIDRFNILKELPLSRLSFLDNVSKRQRNFYRRRFFTDTPMRTKRRLASTRYALTTLFCYQRHQEALDNLSDHLIHYIHKIKKTEKKKKQALQYEISQQLDQFRLLYKMAEINRDNPKSVIEKVVYPAVPKATIDKIIRTKEYARKRRDEIREIIINTYSTNYRSILFNILDCLELHSDNPLIIKALGILKQYRHSKSKHYPIDEDIPIEGLISKQASKSVLERDADDNKRILRKPYECAVFSVLRLKLKHKEVWINGAYKYRNPANDLPKDFDENREIYFKMLGMPLSADAYIQSLKEEMAKNLQMLDEGMPQNDLVSITQKNGKPWIKLTPLTKVKDPPCIERMKKAILDKWGVINLLDVLKEVDLRENFTRFFKTAGNREVLDKVTLRVRLLLVLFAIGINAGFRRTAGAAGGIASFEELRHVRKFYINKDDLREVIAFLINRIVTIRSRNKDIWKSTSTACAADSKQFGCFKRNLMSEWSPRHQNSGVMIYWHVNDQYLCVHSQLKTCSSSEVASMLQGVLDQQTDMDIKSQYVDSHGTSELGFALSALQGFELLPRYKTIGKQKLYRPYQDFEVKNIETITDKPIDWQLFAAQYDDVVRHAVALKLGSATADTIVRKFARSHYQHPTFKAFMELGKAIKTIFMCRYLHSVALRQQINAGLNVVENWNSANDFIFYGRGGEISSNYRDEQEVSMLCLHLLQTCVSYINTLLIEELFKDKFWQEQFTDEDFRALSGLFYMHINPYGIFEIDLAKRLMISMIQGADQ